MESAITEKLEEILKALKGAKDQQKDDFNKVENRLLAFEKSMDFISNQFENHKKMTEALIKRNTKLESENEVLKKKVEKLEGNLNAVANEVNDLEQYGRRDCLEIIGIPKEENENPESLVIKLGEKIGVECKSHEIQACHRIGPKSNAGIITKFMNRKLHDQFLRKKRETRQVTGRDLNLQATKVNIFITESLTRKNKELFKSVRERKKEMGWDFAWTRNGMIFVKKSKDSELLTIRSKKDVTSKIV